MDNITNARTEHTKKLNGEFAQAVNIYLLNNLKKLFQRKRLSESDKSFDNIETELTKKSKYLKVYYRFPNDSVLFCFIKILNDKTYCKKGDIVSVTQNL